MWQIWCIFILSGCIYIAWGPYALCGTHLQWVVHFCTGKCIFALSIAFMLSVANLVHIYIEWVHLHCMGSICTVWYTFALSCACLHWEMRISTNWCIYAKYCKFGRHLHWVGPSCTMWCTFVMTCALLHFELYQCKSVQLIANMYHTVHMDPMQCKCTHSM